MMKTLHWLSNCHYQGPAVQCRNYEGGCVVPGIFRTMFRCVLGCDKTCNPDDTISVDKWKSLETKTALWKGLDKYGDVNENVPWTDGPDGFHMCENCYLTLSSTRKLDQARNRQEKGKKRPDLTEHLPLAEENQCQSSAKRLRSSIDGSLQPKNTCVWCLVGADTRHPDRKNAVLSRISTLSAWREFKRHTVRLENETLRSRLTMLVESISALTDAFAADIYYHKHCWLQYVVNTQSKRRRRYIFRVCLTQRCKLCFCAKLTRSYFLIMKSGHCNPYLESTETLQTNTVL